MGGDIGGRKEVRNSRNSPSAARDTLKTDKPELYEFGPFRLEPKERKLLRGNEVVGLTPKASGRPTRRTRS